MTASVTLTRRGRRDCVFKFLIAYGAVVDVIDDTGSTPLHFASSEGHVGVVKVSTLCRGKPNSAMSIQVLLSHEADVHKLDINKRSALHEAAKEGHFDVMKVRSLSLSSGETI